MNNDYTTYGTYTQTSTLSDTRCIQSLANFDAQLATLNFDYTAGSATVNTITNFAPLIFDYN